jgi:hypothetical protein
MRRLSVRQGRFWFLIVWLVASLGFADSPGPSRKHHAWGRCSPGAWKIVSVVTQSIDERGMVGPRSITETKTTLTEIDDDSVTIEVRTIVEAGGRRFDREPQYIRQGFQGEPVGGDLKFKDLGADTVAIENTKIACRVASMEYTCATSKTFTTVYYSDNFVPYILRRHSVTKTLDGSSVLSETDAEVVAVSMPCEILGEVKCAAQVKTVQRHPNGMITTLAFVSPDVPGGVVCHTSKELDKSGRLTRQSVLKLVAYSFDPEEDRSGLFGRKRPSRFRRSTGHQQQPSSQQP